MAENKIAPITPKTELDYMKEKGWFYDYDVTGISESYSAAGKSFSYIPWAEAFRVFKGEFDNKASFRVLDHEGDPLFGAPGRHFVKVRITACGRIEEETFPLMNRAHKSIENPDSREISDNIQRAFVKCMARGFGFGLSLWAKEDTTPSKPSVQSSSIQAENITKENYTEYRLQSGNKAIKGLQIKSLGSMWETYIKNHYQFIVAAKNPTNDLHKYYKAGVKQDELAIKKLMELEILK